MRSYTNRDGDSIEVSEDHLLTAIRIKKELQNASPSRKCSWATLVKMMEREGYDDAQNCESYRHMIKHHQKSIGELPQLKEHAEMVSDGKLASIKEAVGEISYEKRENQHVLRELNKLKRSLIDFALTAEQIGQAFKEYDWSAFHIDVKPRTVTSGNKMIVCLSDMHIGALVDVETNRYNFAIALERLGEFAGHIIKDATDNGITDIHVVNIGDVVEHSNMRYGQAFEAEFVYNDQIVYAADAIIKFLTQLALEGFNLTYAGIAGNHDRSNDKDKTIDGDHAVKPINYAIRLFIEHAKIGQIRYIQAEDYEHKLLGVNGQNFKFVHGDLDSFKNEGLVAKHSDNDGIEYTAVVMGHFHHFRALEVGYHKWIVLFGSLKGVDNYSERIRKKTPPSQGYIIVDADGKLKIERIELS